MERKNRRVPQRRQKARWAGGEDWCQASASSPSVTRNLASATPNQVTVAADDYAASCAFYRALGLRQIALEERNLDATRMQAEAALSPRGVRAAGSARRR